MLTNFRREILSFGIVISRFDVVLTILIYKVDIQGAGNSMEEILSSDLSVGIVLINTPAQIFTTLREGLRWFSLMVDRPQSFDLKPH